MSLNIMNEYIKITQKEIISYMKLIFENKFNKKICDSFIEAYFNIRYYNYDTPNTETTFRKKILESLDIEKAKLIDEMPEKEEAIRQFHTFCPFILYFDNVTYYKDIKKIIERIENTREKVLKKEKNATFRKEFMKLIKDSAREKADYLKKFESSEFEIKIKPFDENMYVFESELKANIKFPKIYSEQIINEVFNTGTILEDKLQIEYYLIAVKIIQDAVKGEFKKEYICNFTPSLFTKKAKLNSLLNEFENAVIQDRLILKIKYTDYLKRKNDVVSLMKRGFRFAVIMDDSFEINYKNMEKLNIFNYTLINENLKYYKEFMSDKVLVNNVLKIYKS